MNVPDERGLKLPSIEVRVPLLLVEGEMNVPDERGLKHAQRGVVQLAAMASIGEMNVPDERGLKPFTQPSVTAESEAR